MAELAAVSGQDPTVLGRALVELALNVEGVLREMDARHQGTDAASLPGSTVLFEELTPWPAPVDGAALLTALAETFSRYVVLPAGGADLLALWVVHSYALDAAQVTPILALVSIAETAGGPWLDDARKAIAKLEGLRPEDDSAAVLLLKDMHALFTERKTDRLLSSELVEGLKAMEDRPWPEWGRESRLPHARLQSSSLRLGCGRRRSGRGKSAGRGMSCKTALRHFPATWNFHP